MIQNTADIKSQEKRVCQRLELNRRVQLSLANGQLIKGLTEDISLGGVRIKTDDKFEVDAFYEQTAILQVLLDDELLSAEFPCHIVRCHENAMCLQLDKKKAAAFGLMLTRGLLKQKKQG
ncbi:PilZ domain-containing protein [sulfur-oxidizing endosymbiont of Gigantopelta aegis]|uniref:PilZ domain-containing protein n=1 Tax=sulfur-oxidizing endosymbiont of Gigantopelta aegis TaxID=2794934 RepID=UPI0018DE3D4B|nr:PilZ domain-containing protein [sulfur-oxidizing endosymbiont of Gigantopelta aegis]